MERGDAHLLLIEIERKLFLLWDTGDQSFRKKIELKICIVMEYVCRHEFHPYIRRNRQLEARTHTKTWEMAENPLFDNPDKRARVWRSMRKRQAAVIAHFQGDDLQQDLPLD